MEKPYTTTNHNNEYRKTYNFEIIKDFPFEYEES